jgi:hypothetical protein
MVQGGEILNANTTRFFCPYGSVFSDSLSGLYGAGAVAINDPSWIESGHCPVSVSSFGYMCYSCFAGA